MGRCRHLVICPDDRLQEGSSVSWPRPLRPTATPSLHYAPPHFSWLALTTPSSARHRLILVYVSLLTHYIISASQLFVYINVSSLYCKLLRGKLQCFIRQTFIQHLQWYGHIFCNDMGCGWHGLLDVWPWVSVLTLRGLPPSSVKWEENSIYPWGLPSRRNALIYIRCWEWCQALKNISYR